MSQRLANRCVQQLISSCLMLLCRRFASGSPCIFEDNAGTARVNQILDLNPKVTNTGSQTLCGLRVKYGGGIEALGLIFFRNVVNLTVNASNFDYQNLGAPVPTSYDPRVSDNCFTASSTSDTIENTLSKVQT